MCKGPPEKPKCAACRRLGLECRRCVFAPHFPAGAWGSARFAIVREAYGGPRNLANMIHGYNAVHLSPAQRRDAVNSLIFEAVLRRRDPVYGAVGAIRILSERLRLLGDELAATRRAIAQYTGEEPEPVRPVQGPAPRPNMRELDAGLEQAKAELLRHLEHQRRLRAMAEAYPRTSSSDVVARQHQRLSRKIDQARERAAARAAAAGQQGSADAGSSSAVTVAVPPPEPAAREQDMAARQATDDAYVVLPLPATARLTAIRLALARQLAGFVEVSTEQDVGTSGQAAADAHAVPPQAQTSAAAAAGSVPIATDQGTTSSEHALEESSGPTTPDLKRKREAVGDDIQEQGPSNTVRPPCAACQRLRRPCTPECVFAPHFPNGNRDAVRFATAHDACGGSGKLADLISSYHDAGLSPAQQREAVAKLIDVDLAKLILGCRIEPGPADAAPPLVQQPPPSEQQAPAAATGGVPEAADQGGDPSQAVGSASEAELASKDTTDSEQAQGESSEPTPPDSKRKKEDSS
ncbi:hypothetical protein ACP70R_015304 [Stipagrostis hirtigluma subsp. patula]